MHQFIIDGVLRLRTIVVIDQYAPTLKEHTVLDISSLKCNIYNTDE